MTEAPVWLTYFSSYSHFKEELGCLEQANAVKVGPRILATGKGPDILEGPQGPERCYIIEEYLGVSLSDMLAGGEAPCLFGEGAPIALCEVESEERKRQVAKILFDITAALKNLHDKTLFYLDLKPSNICVQAYGPNCADLRASLVDFESMRAAIERPPSVSSAPYYKALFQTYAQNKGLEDRSASNRTIDQGFLCLLVACLTTGKTVSELREEDIDEALKLPGMEFFKVGDKRFLDFAITNKHLDALARAAGLEKIGKGATELDLKAAELANRGGYVDGVDRVRLERDPEYILNKRALDIALVCHKHYNEVKLKDATRDDTLEDFMSQRGIKIRQGLRQACDFQGYVEELGYRLAPKDRCDEGFRLVTKLDDDEVEWVAMTEHAHWMALHEAEGWVYGEYTDEEADPPTNRFLLDWPQLCEKGLQKYDLETARGMIGYLEEAGLVVCDIRYDPLLSIGS
ncbi:hypothetical protein [Gordonibacter sp.]|uniref:hypothetical protein n=1 Tax=Gordonibacter sp. TaxID=1968902 RepID=UPI001F9130A0|nr:hypothetical protein [Gordonibacter sp.]HIW75908.1 hypothetical protein [Candidatus Gordonibacter avicola]